MVELNKIELKTDNGAVGPMTLQAKIIYWMVGLLFATSLAFDKEKDPFHELPKFQVPGEYRNIVSGYRNWSRLTGLEPSPLHWDSDGVLYIKGDVDTYRNNHSAYLQDWSDEWLDESEADNRVQFRSFEGGTTLVKEHFDPGKTKTAKSMTVMVKRDPGYDPEYGDWQYIGFNHRGQVLVAGNSRYLGVKNRCLSCHRHMAERDFVFSTQYSPQEKLD